MVQSVPGSTIAGEAGRVPEAIREILSASPDVVLCDLMLDGGNGLDVMRAVRTQKPHIDFYILSSFAAEPYRNAATRAGARGFFDKSSEFERVREILAQRAATTKP
jgi:DNA-binding NarL/FixJ family response regulator